MAQNDWRIEVARLMDQVAEALRTRNDRGAEIAFGTAVVYLHKAGQRGDNFAAQLLEQAASVTGDGPTDRFTFAPGELEALKVRPRND